MLVATKPVNCMDDAWISQSFEGSVGTTTSKTKFRDISSSSLLWFAKIGFIAISIVIVVFETEECCFECDNFESYIDDEENKSSNN